jgi:hydroxymethylpyrimidine pyrophosphatase-like HAD family hydrolase
MKLKANGSAIPVRMIAVDMDGTLLGPDGKVSPRNQAALRTAERAEVEVVVASGRRHSFAARHLYDLGLRQTNALVSSNGTVTRTLGGHLIQRSLLPAATARWLCSHLDEFRGSLVITFDKFGPDGDDARGALVVEKLEELHASISKWMAANEPYIAHITPLEKALEGEDPIQMMLCGPVERMRRAEGRLLECPGIIASTGTQELSPHAEVALHKTEYADRDLSILDLLPPGCSKGSALEQLAVLRGIRMDEVLAIGDNWNDVPMFEAAGHAVVMENAPEALKRQAALRGWSLGKRFDEDGVAEAIETALGRP